MCARRTDLGEQEKGGGKKKKKLKTIIVVGYAVQGLATACTRITRGVATLNRVEISVNGVNARLESSLISFFSLSLSNPVFYANVL